MKVVTDHTLPDDVPARAAQHELSSEVEARSLLEGAVQTPTHLRVGEALAKLGHQLGLTDMDHELIARPSNVTPAEPMSFEDSCDSDFDS